MYIVSSNDLNTCLCAGYCVVFLFCVISVCCRQGVISQNSLHNNKKEVNDILSQTFA